MNFDFLTQNDIHILYTCLNYRLVIFMMSIENWNDDLFLLIMKVRNNVSLFKLLVCLQCLKVSNYYKWIIGLNQGHVAKNGGESDANDT